MCLKESSLINWEKSVLTPTQKIAYLGYLIDSFKMIISLPDQKMVRVINECQDIFLKGCVTVRALESLIGKLTSRMLAVVQATLH